MGEAKLCSKGCGKKLGPNNHSGICTPCQTSGTHAHGAADGSPRVKRASPGSRMGGGNTRKNFKVVANALGFDPDGLIDTFCEGWLAKVRGSVHLGDETDGYELPERKA